MKCHCYDYDYLFITRPFPTSGGELFFNNDCLYAYNDRCQGRSRLSYHSVSSLVTYGC